MNTNLGRSIRLLVKSGAVKATSAVIASKPVRKVSTFMITAWLKERAMLKGKKLSYIARVFTLHESRHSPSELRPRPRETPPPIFLRVKKSIDPCGD